MNIVIQILGVMGIAASVIGFQSNRYKNILACRTMNEFLFGIQYILLGAYTGALFEALTLCAVISGIVRFDIFPKLKHCGENNYN